MSIPKNTEEVVIINEVRDEEVIKEILSVEGPSPKAEAEAAVDKFFSDLKIGDSVVVKIEDPVPGYEELEESFHNQLATIVGKNDFVFPFLVEFNDPKVQEILVENPRQFAQYELSLVK